MSRLPVPGSDKGVWGALLNEFLSQAHEADGSLKIIDQNKVTGLESDLAAKVPVTRQVAGHALSADVVLSPSDVGAEPAGLSDATRAILSNMIAAQTGKDTDPTDVGYDLQLMVKQSNADGRATDGDYAHLDTSDPRVFQFGNPGGTQVALANIISAAVEPLAGWGGTKMGPALGIAKRHLLRSPVNRRVLIVLCAKGGTPFLGAAPNGTWGVGRTDASPNLTDQAIIQVQAAWAAAEAEFPGKNRVVGIYGIHGESDGDNGTTGPAWQAAEDAWIDYMRAQLAPYTNLPVIPYVAGGMVPEYLSSGTRTSIRAVQIDTPRRKIGTAYADGVADGTIGDGNHYNAKGQRAIARGMGAAYDRALANILGTPAVVPTGIVLSQSGTTISASWSPIVGRVIDYHVRYRVNTGVWVSLNRAQSIDLKAVITGAAALGDTMEVQVSSENETGISAWSASSSLILQTAPAALSGLAAGTSTYSSIPLSWSASTRATSYLVEYKSHAVSSWSTFRTVTVLSSTVSGLADGTAYDFRVTPIGSAGSGEPATLSNVSTLVLAGLFDAVSATAFDGVSVRKLRSAYTGAMMRVRRDSDNAEQDIGFVGSNLDTTSLLTFVGVANGFVTKLYNQADATGRDWVQTNTNYQPQVVTSGALITATSGIPAIKFDGVDDHLLPVTGMYAAGAASVGIVLQSVGGGLANAAIFDESRAASATGEYQLLRQASSGAQITQYIQADTGPAILALSASAIAPAPMSNTIRQITVIDTGSSSKKFVDGVAVNPVAYTRSGTVTADVASFGARVRTGTISNPMPFMFSEAVRFTTAGGITGADQAVVEGSQKAYFSTP